MISEARKVTKQLLFSHKLAPLPPSLFDQYGMLRKTSKSNLANKLWIMYEGTTAPDVQLTDGNEVFYHTTWPRHGTVSHLLRNIQKTVASEFPVFLIYDHYNEFSIKTSSIWFLSKDL